MRKEGHILNCKKCGRRKWGKTAETMQVGGQTVRVWICRAYNKRTGLFCGHKQPEETAFYEKKLHPRVLYIDIERSLGEFYGYDRRVPSRYIPIDFLRREPFLLCYAAGWVEETETGYQYILSDCLRQEDVLARDDRRILLSLWSLLDSADYVVGHNVRRFDNRKINERFILLGMPAPSGYKTLDTYVWGKGKFDFMGNGLDFLAPRFGGHGKMTIEREDWIRAVETGDPQTLLDIETYCRADVRNGIRVFRRMVEYIESSGEMVYK